MQSPPCRCGFRRTDILAGLLTGWPATDQRWRVHHQGRSVWCPRTERCWRRAWLQLQPQAVAKLAPVSRLRRRRGRPQCRQLLGQCTHARSLLRYAQRPARTAVVLEARTLMRMCTAQQLPAALQQRAGPTRRILDGGGLVVALQVRKALGGRVLARVAGPALRQRRQRLVQCVLAGALAVAVDKDVQLLHAAG